jgi:DNA-binding HxlR family transcriptional regulator
MATTPSPNDAAADRNAEACPVVQTLDAVGTPWRLHVFYALRDGELRFNELKRATGGRSNTVSDTLDVLAEHDLVSRRTEEAAPIAVYYRLTRTGEAFVDELDALGRWAVAGLDAVETPDETGIGVR